MESEHEITIPLRSNGTPKRFWYDREAGHMIHRRADESLVAIGFECCHPVEEIS